MTAALVAVVAMALNGVIGRDGAMPWRLSGDLRRYRALTMNKPMIMGRKTLESIGRVLDGRDTIVLTRHGSVPFAGAIVAVSADEAVDRARECAERRGAAEIVVAGGGEVYAQLLDRVSRLYVTHVEAEPAGDATFPPMDPAVWRRVSEERFPAGEKDSAATRFAVYDRQV